jgi:hypothetical protein
MQPVGLERKKMVHILKAARMGSAQNGEVLEHGWKIFPVMVPVPSQVFYVG